MMNFMVIALAALVPLIVGFVWYNPKVLGTAWMQAADMTEDKMKGANMLVIFGLTYVLSFMFAMMSYYLVVHQAHVFSTLVDEPGFNEEGSAINLYFKDFMEKYGQNFRTFKHGAFHGILAGIFIALPILAINALFERKGFKYIAINAGYWLVCLILIGGIVCAYA
jgi:hypothetical protein